MTWTGGCLCGVVRYRLASEPYDAGWCHCRTCQLNSGAPAMAFATVPVRDWVAERGEEDIRSVKSSSFGHRCFCGRCGTPLLMKVDHQPETLDFSIATLDNPDALPPTFHIFFASHIVWADIRDALPRHERFRPGTRGFQGTEPPDDGGAGGT
jgi:hypothetical protein